jgi:hypothetical protein
LLLRQIFQRSVSFVYSERHGKESGKTHQAGFR